MFVIFWVRTRLNLEMSSLGQKTVLDSEVRQAGGGASLSTRCRKMILSKTQRPLGDAESNSPLQRETARTQKGWRYGDLCGKRIISSSLI